MSMIYESKANLPISDEIITIATVDYRAIDWSPTYGTREIRRNDGFGDSEDFMLRSEPATDTVTLQLVLSTTAIPALGATFAKDTKTWVITSVQPVKPQGDFHTVQIGVRYVADV